MCGRPVRLTFILFALAYACLNFIGCGGSGGNPLNEQPAEGVSSSAQNVRLTVRLADRTSTISQLDEETPIRVVRALLVQGQQAVQQLELEVEPEDTQATLGFTNVQPGTYTVVVLGLDQDGEVLAETSAELVVEFGRISRVTLILRPGVVPPPPPPPPPPVTLNGYFVRQGATGSGLGIDDPSGDLLAILGLWETEPRDFIFLFFGPQPLVLPGVVDLPDGLTLIGEGTGLSVLPQATEEQVVVPPGNPPILGGSLRVGSDSRLSGFVIEQNGAGANLELSEVQNVILEDLEFQRPEVDPPFSHLLLNDFTGLLEVQGCFFSGQSGSSEFGSIFCSVPSGQAVIRVVNSELSEDTFQLRAGPGAVYLGVDLRGNILKGGLDVVLDTDSTGDILLEGNTLRGRAGFQPGLAIGHGNGAGGEIQFRNNLWDDCGPVNFTSQSTATQGRIALLDDNRFTGGQAGQANYVFFGGTYEFVYHDNRRLDPTEDGQDTNIAVLGATVAARFSESIFSNGLGISLFQGNLAIGILNNTSLLPLTSSVNVTVSPVAGPSDGIQARLVGNILEALDLQGGTAPDGLLEVEELADIGNLNTISSTPGQSGNVENLTPGSVLVPPASVPPIEFPF